MHDVGAGVALIDAVHGHLFHIRHPRHGLLGVSIAWRVLGLPGCGTSESQYSEKQEFPTHRCLTTLF
jgi:hypothetical protein